MNNLSVCVRIQFYIERCFFWVMNFLRSPQLLSNKKEHKFYVNRFNYQVFLAFYDNRFNYQVFLACEL